MHCLSQTRYGAYVAPQRCTILRIGKAYASYHTGACLSPLKIKVVLDMGYTLVALGFKFYKTK